MIKKITILIIISALCFVGNACGTIPVSSETYETIPFGNITVSTSENVSESDVALEDDSVSDEFDLTYNSDTGRYEGFYSSDEMDITYNVIDLSEGITPSTVNEYTATIYSANDRSLINEEAYEITETYFGMASENCMDRTYSYGDDSTSSELFLEEWQTRYASIHIEEESDDTVEYVLTNMESGLNVEMSDYAIVYNYVPYCYYLSENEIPSHLNAEDIDPQFLPDSLDGLWEQSYCFRRSVDGIPVGTVPVLSNGMYDTGQSEDGSRGSYRLQDQIILCTCNDCLIQITLPYIKEMQMQNEAQAVIPITEILDTSLNPISRTIDNMVGESHMTVYVYGAEIIYVMYYPDYNGLLLPEGESECELVPCWAVYFSRGALNERSLRSIVLINAITGEIMTPDPF